MNNRMAKISKILMVVCGIALVFVLFTPIWKIDLEAPQYPEGLQMKIHASKLSGNVDIINGLNHYIGMKTIHEEDFTEFKVLPVIIGFFAAAFVFVGLIGRKKLLYTVFALFILFGIVAMYDFWKWEYDYGHNLDPNAAIIVPGMAYQPPLIGFKQLLNFGAWSFPDIGGIIFISVGVIALIVSFFELRRRSSKIIQAAILIIGSSLMLSSCNSGPQPIKYGKENCHFCKMTISDNRFASEIVTTKSKAYKFDDSHCILAFLEKKEIKPEDIKAVYFTNYSEPHNFIEADKALFYKSEDLKSPMGGNLGAFENNDDLKKVSEIYPGNTTSWEEIKK